MHALVYLCWIVLICAGLLACGDDGTDFSGPGPGDFVTLVQPGEDQILTQADFARRPIVIVLDFFAAEGFGFGSLRSFRYDSEDVTGLVDVITDGEPPPFQASLSFVPEDDDPGEHDVQVEYTDSRGTVHRVAWSFTVTP